MIYEKIDIPVDVEKLRAYVLEHVVNKPAVMQSEHFGGWSVLSYTGAYTDGWQLGHLCYKQREDGTEYWCEQTAKNLGVVNEQLHVNPTELCTGYVLELIESIKKMGLRPCRARWSLLRAKGESSLHRDARSHLYAVRLHIPIFTNELCTFASEGEEEHVPLGGAYLLRVNRLHQVFNRSDKDRIHLIMNVYDKTGVSKHHRMPNEPTNA